MKGMEIIKKSLSYAALGGIIYICFRYLPGQYYEPKEIVVMTIIAVAVYAVIDFLCSAISTGEEKPKQEPKLEKILEGFGSTAPSCGCATKPIEGFAEVAPAKDDESFLQGNAVDELSKLRDENAKLRDLQKRVDPYDNKGYAYSTSMNQVTEEDESVPNGIRKIGKIARGSRATDGILESDMIYTDYNTLPVADGYKSRAYELGYSYLPPEKWYPAPPHPPVCVTDRQALVQPVFTTGVPADLKEWGAATRITPPANINVDYIMDKLNSGR